MELILPHLVSKVFRRIIRGCCSNFWRQLPYNTLCYFHYNDVIMGTMVYRFTGVSIINSTVCSGPDQKDIKAPRNWPLCGEFTGDRWIPHTKGQWRGKCLHLMTSSRVIVDIRLRKMYPKRHTIIQTIKHIFVVTHVICFHLARLVTIACYIFFLLL